MLDLCCSVMRVARLGSSLDLRAGLLARVQGQLRPPGSGGLTTVLSALISTVTLVPTPREETAECWHLENRDSSRRDQNARHHVPLWCLMPCWMPSAANTPLCSFTMNGRRRCRMGLPWGFLRVHSSAPPFGGPTPRAGRQQRRGSWRGRLQGSGAVEAAHVLSGPDLHISSLKTWCHCFLEVSSGACAGPE